MAIRDRVRVLIACNSFSDVYWLAGLCVGAKIMWIDMREEYAVVRVVAVMNNAIMIMFFSVDSIEDVSMIRSFE